MSSERCPSCRRNVVRHHSGITVRHGPERAVGDAVLAQVHPLVLLAEHQTGKKIQLLSDDNYILGFVSGLIALTSRRVNQNLSQVDSGTILFLAINQVYGKNVI
jgi:hypothetical protein